MVCVWGGDQKCGNSHFISFFFEWTLPLTVLSFFSLLIFSSHGFQNYNKLQKLILEILLMIAITLTSLLWLYSKQQNMNFELLNFELALIVLEIFLYKDFIKLEDKISSSYS